MTVPLFSTREIDVIRLLADGLTRPQAAAKLGLTEWAIHARIERAYRRLGVHSAAALVQLAVDAGELEPPGPRGLADEEREVLHLVAEGLTAEAIARQLGVSTAVVHGRKDRVFRRLGVNSSVAAVLAAIRAGLIQVDGITATGDQS